MTPLETTVTVHGVDRLDCEASAIRELDEFFGGTSWEFTRREVVPLIQELGGKVRLYEGRFAAAAVDA